MVTQAYAWRHASLSSPPSSLDPVTMMTRRERWSKAMKLKEMQWKLMRKRHTNVHLPPGKSSALKQRVR